MTRDKLEAYRSKKAEIGELCEFQKSDGACNAVAAGRQKNIVGRLQTECHEVEQWVDNIQDARAQRVVKLYFLQGMKQRQIARKLYMSQSSVSRIISDAAE